MIGSVLDGRYKILRLLGSGGMGEVYLAEHLALQRLEALKVLRPELANEPSFVARFRREARANNRVVHPNIVGVHDFGQLPDGRFYLSTEYAEGESLADVLDREHVLSLRRALHVLRQLADAVAHAHEQGVIHRDLKPENLLLVTHRGHADVVKVLDFGIAKIVAAGWRETVGLSVQGDSFGTPPYMAPEQISGNGSDPRIDLYAIGCIAFELLVGETPFAGSRPMMIMHRHVSEQPVAPSTRATYAVPPELDAIVLRLLAKAPDDRFQTARELKAALDAVPVREALPSVTQLHTFATDGDDATMASTPRPEHAQHGLSVATLAGQLAEALFDVGEPDLALLQAASWLAQHVEERALLDAERARLERLTDEAEQWSKAHEATLRFGAAEVAFAHRATALEAHAKDAGLAALEARVSADRERADNEQAALLDRAIELAARADELDETLVARGLEVARRALELAGKRRDAHVVELAHELRARLG